MPKKKFLFDPSHTFSQEGSSYKFVDSGRPWMFVPETSYNSSKIVKVKRVKNSKKVLENAKTNVDFKKFSASE